MLKSFRFFVLFLLIFGCKDSNQDNTEIEEIEVKNTSILMEADIAKLNYVEFDLDQKVETLAESWEPYFELRNTLNDFKKADFSFFESDEKAVADLTKNLREVIPDTLNTQAILSRITIIESMLYKLKESQTFDSTSKENLSDALKDLFIAYSNLNFQLNKKIEKESQRIERP